MVSSPNLFNIIKSLTPNEKRYFKIFASRHVIGSKNNYEKLFDALDALPDHQPYDETAFKKSNKSKHWAKNLAVEKTQLEDLIFKAMRNFHAEKTEQGKLDAAIANIRFLLDKGHVEHAMKLWERAYEIAEGQGNLIGMVQLYDYKTKLSLGTIFDGAGANSDDEEKVLQALVDEKRVKNINLLVYQLYKTNEILTHQDVIDKCLLELTELEKSPLFTDWSKITTYITRGMIFEKRKQYTQACLLYQDIIALMEEGQLKVNNRDSKYRIVLSNYLACLHHLEYYNEFFPLINKLEKIPVATYKEKASLFKTTSQFKLIYYLNTWDIEGFINLAIDIDKGLKKHSSFFPKKTAINIRFNLCLLFFKHKDHSHLLLAINQLHLIIGRDKTYLFIKRDIQFIEIIAHLQLQNYALADSLLQNMERWLRENRLNNSFTSELLKALRGKLTLSISSAKTNGQLTEISCPNDLLMLKEILVKWQVV